MQITQAHGLQSVGLFYSQTPVCFADKRSCRYDEVREFIKLVFIALRGSLMPRRNLWIIFAVSVISLVCYRTADPNSLGRRFSEVADHIERRYVQSVDRNALWAAAVKGMVGQLDDPNSEYIEPQEAAELQEQLDQKFGGIGIQVSRDPETKRLTVISPIVGSPAYKAGIVAGDVIVKIDGKPTREMEMKDATNLMRGKPGETVQLSLERTGQAAPIDLPPIVREVINIDSVMGDTRNADDSWNFLISENPRIGYVRVASFGERTVEELKAALDKLRAANMQGLVLDLRNDPGGLLPAAVETCDLFVPEGSPIVSIKGRDRSVVQREFKAAGGEKFLGFPMAVLVNRGSASASEIVAACLQDSGRAAVIGERSYGKGTVQNVIELHGNHGVLKLTTADYWRPSNRNIHRHKDAKETDEWGVSPDKDLEVNMADADWRKWMLWRSDRDIVRPHLPKPAVDEATTDGEVPAKAFADDPPLRKALEYLGGKLSAAEKRPAAA